MKDFKNNLESYLEFGRKLDYMNRIFASFAEIYNYLPVDFNKLNIETEDLASYLADTGKDIKVYSIFGSSDDCFKYTTYSMNQRNKIADMIAMAVRIIETFHIHVYQVKIQVCETYKDCLANYLDCLDINYEMEIDNSISMADFQIVTTLEEEIVLVKGYGVNNYTYCTSFAISNLLSFSGDFLKSDTNNLDVVVTYQSELEEDHAIYLVQELRLNGFKTEILENQDNDFIKENYLAKYLIRLQESDIANDEVLLIDLYTKEEEKINEMDLINHLDLRF